MVWANLFVVLCYGHPRKSVLSRDQSGDQYQMISEAPLPSLSLFFSEHIQSPFPFCWILPIPGFLGNDLLGSSFPGGSSWYSPWGPSRPWGSGWGEQKYGGPGISWAFQSSAHLLFLGLNRWHMHRCPDDSWKWEQPGMPPTGDSIIITPWAGWEGADGESWGGPNLSFMQTGKFNRLYNLSYMKLP